MKKPAGDSRHATLFIKKGKKYSTGIRIQDVKLLSKQFIKL